MRRAWRYAAIGAMLGLGAPLGLAALRRSLRATERGWLHRERAPGRLTYAYLAASTCAAFGAFGLILGRRADALMATHQALDRLRDEFASVIAHDLRSPVNALRLQSELLLEQTTAQEVLVSRRAIERVHRATDNLAEMIDDLLDASRLESRRLALHLEPRALDELATEIVERQRPALGLHPVELRVQAASRALVDPQRFAQILTNLLDNAAKYSDDGAAIRVLVAPSLGGVSVRVEDEGWGITADEQAQLFDRFYQAKRARAKKSGLGLGLYIVKGLVAAHQGRISVASTPGCGTTFMVWFPAAA